MKVYVWHLSGRLYVSAAGSVERARGQASERILDRDELDLIRTARPDEVHELPWGSVFLDPGDDE